MLHRIFLAINLPPEIKNKLEQLQSQWSGIPAKWVKIENLHITLLFLGSVKSEFLPKIFETTKTVAESFSSFEIKLKKIAFFPPKKMPPRMIWVFLEESKTLTDLKTALEQKIITQKPSFQQEERKLSPHITLARIKKFEFRNLEKDEIPEVNETINLSFGARSIDIMESHLKRGGPLYSLLQSFPLKYFDF